MHSNMCVRAHVCVCVRVNERVFVTKLTVRKMTVPETAATLIHWHMIHSRRRIFSGSQYWVGSSNYNATMCVCVCATAMWHRFILFAIYRSQRSPIHATPYWQFFVLHSFSLCFFGFLFYCDTVAAFWNYPRAHICMYIRFSSFRAFRFFVVWFDWFCFSLCGWR